MISQEIGKLVYLLAASHSGSTLTAMLLNSHPDICTAGELKISSLDDPHSYRCSCRALIKDCTFWKTVRNQMVARGFEFDVLNAKTSLLPTASNIVNRLLRPLHRGKLMEFVRDSVLAVSPVWREHRVKWQQRNHALINSIAAVSGSRYVVDSSKTGLRLKFLRRVPGLEVKVIRLIRDGRAVSLTYMDSDNFADARDPALRGGGTGPTARPRLGMEAAATRWLRSNHDAEAVLKTIPKADIAIVKYEDLCVDPHRTLSRIFSFLELNDSEAFHQFRAVDHHVVGNGMRLDDSNEIVLDDRWKSVLTKNDLMVFDQVAGHLNRQYGYSSPAVL